MSTISQNTYTECSPMKTYYRSIFILLSFLLFACTSENEEAQRQLNTARQLYSQAEYALAKQTLDSLKANHPKAFPQLQAGILLLDSIRRGENEQIIAQCDSLISSFEPKVEQEKTKFSFQQNKQYQETGSYISKESVTSSITSTTLRSGVEENGQLYIESVFIGGQKHNKIKILSKDGSFAE